MLTAREVCTYVLSFTCDGDFVRLAGLRVIAATERGIAPDDDDMSGLRKARDAGGDGARAAASIVLDFVDGIDRCQYCHRDKREIVRWTGCVGEHVDIPALLATARDLIDPPVRANASVVLNTLQTLARGWVDSLDCRALSELRDAAVAIRHRGPHAPSDTAIVQFVDAVDAIADWHRLGRPLPERMRSADHDQEIGILAPQPTITSADDSEAAWQRFIADSDPAQVHGDWIAATAAARARESLGPSTSECERLYANGARVKVVHLRNALKFMIKVIEGHVASCGRPDAGEPVSLDFLAKLLADARRHADAHEYFLHGMRMAAAGNVIDPPSEEGLAAWRARREQAVEPRADNERGDG